MVSQEASRAGVPFLSNPSPLFSRLGSPLSSSTPGLDWEGVSRAVCSQGTPTPAWYRPRPATVGRSPSGRGAQGTPESAENRCPAPAHSAAPGTPGSHRHKARRLRPAGEGPQAHPHPDSPASRAPQPLPRSAQALRIHCRVRKRSAPLQGMLRPIGRPAPVSGTLSHLAQGTPSLGGAWGAGEASFRRFFHST